MKTKLAKRILVILFVLAGLAALGQILLSRCPELPKPKQVEIESVAYIKYLYPWPNAKVSFACQTVAVLKSPFAPKMIDDEYYILKENGLSILETQYREGALVVTVSREGGLYTQFREPVKPRAMPAFAKAVSLYVDGKKLKIGHVSYREFADEFTFVTILGPFLLPGEHIGKIVILLPSGKTTEYEWPFEITWH